MTSIIKLRDADHATVRSLSLTGASAPAQEPPEAAVDPELAALRLQVSALSQQVKHRDTEIEQLKHQVEAARRSGEAEGRQAGLASADARIAERLAALDAGVGRATERFAQEVAALEALAVALAHEGLAKVLDDPAAYRDLVSATIRAHLRRLEGQALMSVAVSAADFPTGSDLADLAAHIGSPGLDVAASDDLPAGGCRIGLRLGALEVGIPQQWEKLSATLRSLAEPERDA